MRITYSRQNMFPLNSKGSNDDIGFLLSDTLVQKSIYIVESAMLTNCWANKFNGESSAIIIFFCIPQITENSQTKQYLVTKT